MGMHFFSVSKVFLLYNFFFEEIAGAPLCHLSREKRAKSRELTKSMLHKRKKLVH